MISYLKEYVSISEYNHLLDVLNKNILKILEVNEVNVKKNLDYFKSKKLDIALILEYRPDLVFNDLVKDNFEKNIKYLKKCNPKDYIIFGI